MTSANHEGLPPLRVPWRLYVLALVPPAAAALAMVAAYDSISDPMPVHWGFSGEPDAWRDRSVTGVLVLVLSAPVICIVAGAATAGFIRMYATTLSEPGGPKTRTDVLRSWHELDAVQPVLAWWTVAVSASLTVSLIGMSGPWQWTGGGVWTAAGLVGVVVATVWLCVEMSRRVEEITRRYPHGDGRRRRWGLFVEIPDSDRVFVDTGSGMNYTFNTATRGGRIGAAVLMLLLIGAVVMMLAMAVAALL